MPKLYQDNRYVSPYHASLNKRLAQLYDATQRPDEAAEWKKKLAELEPDKK